MAQTTFKDKSFLDVLSSPWTVLPVGLGGSLLIVGLVLVKRKELLFAGVAALLFGLGVLMTHWLFFAENAELARLRREIGERLDAAGGAGRHTPATEAQQRGTPAPAE